MDKSIRDGGQLDNVNNSRNTEAVKLLCLQYLCIHVCNTALWAAYMNLLEENIISTFVHQNFRHTTHFPIITILKHMEINF